MALASLPLTGALKCYNNIDDIAFNALAWRARIDTFFSSDYPLLTNFSENSPSFVREVDGQNFTCLVGQAYPRGFQLTSTCLYFPFPRGFPPEGLVLVNMLAGTCDTDFCNKSATPRTQPTARARTPCFSPYEILTRPHTPQTARTPDRTQPGTHPRTLDRTHPATKRRRPRRSIPYIGSDCNDSPSWSKGRKLNLGLGMITISFLIIAIGCVIIMFGCIKDSTRPPPAPAGEMVAYARNAERGDGAKRAAKPKQVPARYLSLFSVATSGQQVVFFLGCMCMAATGMAMPLMSWNFGRAIGNLGNQDSLYVTMGKISTFLVYLALGQLVTASLGYAALEPTSVLVAQLWRERYLRAVLRQDVGWFDVNGGGGILAAMAEDTAAVQRGTGIQLGLALMNGVSTLGALVLAFSWAGHWNVALVCIAVVPLLVLASAVMLITNERMSKYESKAFLAAGAISSEAIGAMRTVQALNAQDGIIERFRHALVPAERAGLLKTVANGCSIGAAPTPHETVTSVPAKAPCEHGFASPTP